MKNKFNKKGGIGNIVSMSIAIIIIIFILAIFVFVNGIFKKNVDKFVGNDVKSEMLTYMREGHVDFAEIRFLVAGGTDVNSAILEVNKGEK